MTKAHEGTKDNSTSAAMESPSSFQSAQGHATSSSALQDTATKEALTGKAPAEDHITSVPTIEAKPPTQDEGTLGTLVGSETTRGVASNDVADPDPMDLEKERRPSMSSSQIRREHPGIKRKNKRKLRQFYTAQNAMIDQYLQAGDEERLQALDDLQNGPYVRFAVNASFAVNFCLFCIQLYAAVTTGSLSLFATAADAFMDLVSSIVMLTTSRLAQRPNIYKYPVGRTRIETIGIILFCSLMTTVAVELIVESGRTLGSGATDSKELQLIPLVCVGVAIFAKSSLCIYCFIFRRYPSAHVFFLDHRNDIIVNVFGLTMSIVGDRFVWYLDPVGAILIGLLILFSWASTAFDHVWLIVGKGAPKEFVSKVVYMAMTHDTRILKVDTCRAYHAGQRYYVECDIIMDADTPLRISHDVGQTLQRKMEGLSDVERAFVHVDYEDLHDPKEEHKPVQAEREKRKSLKERFEAGRQRLSRLSLEAGRNRLSMLSFGRDRSPEAPGEEARAPA